MLRRLYDWTLSWARSRHAPSALGTISFVESSVFPIPADVIFIPMCAARPDKAMRYAFIASVTSVLGGVFGWLIGLIACWTGLNAGRSSEAVGRAATSGVVRSILAVFAANVVLVPVVQVILDAASWSN